MTQQEEMPKNLEELLETLITDLTETRVEVNKHAVALNELVPALPQIKKLLEANQTQLHDISHAMLSSQQAMNILTHALRAVEGKLKAERAMLNMLDVRTKGIAEAIRDLQDRVEELEEMVMPTEEEQHEEEESGQTTDE